jgi:hypothetical protein
MNKYNYFNFFREIKKTEDEISRRLGHVRNKNIHETYAGNTIGKRHEWKDNIIVPLRLINHTDITQSG